MIAPFTVEGTWNRTVFEIELGDLLALRFVPNDWVIVNNALFHLGDRIAH